jgi:hypothetical protein
VHAAPHSGVVVDVFLRFRTFPRGKTPAFATGPFEALDAVQPARNRDGYELRLYVRTTDPLPVPANPWPDLSGATTADREAKLHEAIFRAWGGEREDVLGALAHDPVVPKDEGWSDDPTWILLGRVDVKATRVSPAGTRPARVAVEPRATVDNSVRLFSLTAGALARWIGV